MAAKTVSQIVDEFIAAVATVGSRCFDLNGHDGLTMEQQTAFFLLGRAATFLMMQLTDKYAGLLELAATTDGKKLIAGAQDACVTAKDACDAVMKARIPPIAKILTANSDSARALDVADDVLVASS
jgi:hypothetical protein